MKTKSEPKTRYECGECRERTNTFVRAFSVLKDHSADAPQNLAIPLDKKESTIANQPYQLDAERKRALGIEYFRRSIWR
jgi:hypothetical protein